MPNNVCFDVQGYYYSFMSHDTIMINIALRNLTKEDELVMMYFCFGQEL